MEATKESTHPSYGVISFSRCQGNPDLVGSDLDKHYHYVTLNISRATLHRTDHDDHYQGSISGDLIRVDMSEAQFSQLLTTMNIANGVPCTIRRILNTSVEPPPRIKGRIHHIRDRFAETIADFATKIQTTALDRMREILRKDRLTKADRDELLRMYEDVGNKLTDYAPFIVDMMNEAVAARVQAAKTEVASFTAVALARIGMTTLDAANSAVKGLPATTDVDRNEDV
jgi:hypothetical protein